MIEVGVALAGRGGYHADAKDKVYSIVVDFLTPETDTTMWYFWGMARNFNVKDEALTAQIREGQGKVFAEDTEVLEQQQRNLLRWPDRRLLMLNIDAGGVQARRVIDRLVAAEGHVTPAKAGVAGSKTPANDPSPTTPAFAGVTTS
jgi:vanillate O-demethylase monooxygenase subunit